MQVSSAERHSHHGHASVTKVDAFGPLKHQECYMVYVSNWWRSETTLKSASVFVFENISIVYCYRKSWKNTTVYLPIWWWVKINPDIMANITQAASRWAFLFPTEEPNLVETLPRKILQDSRYHMYIVCVCHHFNFSLLIIINLSSSSCRRLTAIDSTKIINYSLQPGWYLYWESACLLIAFKNANNN